MNKPLYVFAVVSVLLLMACGNGEQENGHQDATGHGQEHSEENSEGLTLNNESKWVANPETTAGISDMQAAVNEYLQGNNDLTCAQLSAGLTATFDGIISDCTMTGEAHEQLHHYILPLKQEITALSTAEGSACNEQVVHLGDYLAAYSDYFE